MIKNKLSFFIFFLFDKNNNMNILVIHDDSIVGKNITEEIIKKKDKNNWIFVNYFELSILELEAYFIDFSPKIVIYLSENNYILNKFDLIFIITCIKFNLEYLIIFCNIPTNLTKNLSKFNHSIKYLCLYGKYVYGSYGDFINTENEINKLIYKIFITKRENEILKINTDYKINNNYIYVIDVINIIYLISTEKLSIINNNTIDICKNKDTYNIRDLINLILKAFQINIKIEYYSKVNTTIILKDNETEKRDDSTKIYGFNYTTIEKSINETVKWFVNNYPNNSN